MYQSARDEWRRSRSPTVRFTTAKGTEATFERMTGGPAPTKAPTPADAVAHPSRLARFVAARLDPKAYLGLHVTVSLGIAALALWLFGAVLEEVLDNFSFGC